MSQFYLPSNSASSVSTRSIRDSTSNDEEEDDLPYPAELSRSDFLAPDFDPAKYLSTLRNRHQTLEDLRSDLRQRSSLLNRELLDLVNGNYEEFLSLGGDLHGGEEKVEGVRVGLLAFQREIAGIKRGVSERAQEVGSLLQERKEIRSHVVLGRALLEIDTHLEELEEALGVKSDAGKLSADMDDDEDEDDEEDDTIAEEDAVPISQIRRLQRHASQFILIVQMITRIGPGHPFLVAQRPRLEQLKKTLLLDLATALRQAKAAKAPLTTLAIAKIYGDIGAEAESIKTLKGT